MKAIRYTRYGPPDVLELQDIPRPVVGEEDVLVEVRAASVNPLDWHLMRGIPYIVRGRAGLSSPKTHGLGADLSGVVVDVGRRVTRFQPGDEVFGGGSGTLAEYVSIRQDGALVAKPTSLSFAQAAAVPVAACTALQALRDKGQLKAGQKVLVNGGSGGVGTFAVQIAKAYGAEVTAVCGTANVELVGSIGADHVIDYNARDFTRSGQRYDLFVDMVGNKRGSERRRMLTKGGVLVAVGGSNEGRWLGPLADLIKLSLVSSVLRTKAVFFLARLNAADLATLGQLLETRKITPVIDRVYPLSEAAAAIDYLEQGHAKGKVVITV